MQNRIGHPNSTIHHAFVVNHASRNVGQLHTAIMNNNYGKRMFRFSGATDWNELPSSVRSVDSLSVFKVHITEHLFLLRNFDADNPYVYF